jgi:hypothetical protein
MWDAVQNTATHQASDGVLGDLQHHRRLSHRVDSGLRLADASEVRSKESFDGSLDHLLDESFDR